MKKLEDNVYNQELERSDPKFKLWRSVGLMLTYECNCSCEFCYYHCSPQKGGLMSKDTLLGAWDGLKKIAGDSAKIHITGGEPFLYFGHLVDILRKAQTQKIGMIDLLETYGFCAENNSITQKRLKLLDKLNLRRLKISCDPFHQEYVDIEPVRKLAGIAEDILGADRVMVRWRDYLDNPIDLKNMPEEQRKEFYIKTMRDYPPRFTGRAAEKLAPLLASDSIKQISKLNCSRTFLAAKGVHIDPFGNVFSGTCSGIIVGNVTKQPLDEMWSRFSPYQDYIIKTLFEKGPAGLLEYAHDYGYVPENSCAGKCHLCSSVKQFLIDKGLLEDTIGPRECYR